MQGVGTLRLGGWLSRTATAEAAGESWKIARRGLLASAFEATDAAGAVVGEFNGRSLHRGGTLRWNGRELALAPDSAWRERYVVADGERELATIEGKGWGKRPLRITVDDVGAIGAGPLLFAVFVVRALAEDAAGAAAAGGSA